MGKKKQTIAIVYHNVPKDSNEYFSKEHTIIDSDTNDTVRSLQKILVKHNFRVKVLSISPGNLEKFKIKDVDYILNQVDSRAMELRFARILDRLKIPNSGSSYQSIFLSNNKIKSKKVFEAHHLPIPRYSILRLHDRIRKSFVPSPYPLIVKPGFEHCSVGITDHSVVENYDELKACVSDLRNRFHQALLIEEYIPGREFHIPVIQTFENTMALSIAEYIYTNRMHRKWNIYGFDEKWEKEKKTYKYWKFISPPKALDTDVVLQMKRDAVKAFHAFEFKDYGRFDLRFNPKKEKWYFLEANANSDLNENPREATTASILASGMNMEQFVMQIIRNSLIYIK